MDKVMEQPVKNTTFTRGNPLNPTYHLPSYQEVPTEAPRVPRPETEEVEGSKVLPSYYNKYLKKPADTRNFTMNVLDINQRKIPVRTPLDKYTPIDNTFGAQPKRLSNRDPLAPQYNWEHAQKPEAERQRVQKPLAVSTIFKTADIIGKDEENRHKEKKYGLHKEVYNIFSTADIQQRRVKSQLERKAALPDKEFFYEETKHEKATVNAVIPEYNHYQNLKATGLLSNQERYPSPQIFEPPPYKELDEPHKFKVSKNDDMTKIPFAGVDMHGFEVARCHQTVGFLPGPKPVAYDKNKLSFRKGMDPELLLAGTTSKIEKPDVSIDVGSIKLTTVKGPQSEKPSILLRDNVGKEVTSMRKQRPCVVQKDEQAEYETTMVRSLIM